MKKYKLRNDYIEAELMSEDPDLLEGPFYQINLGNKKVEFFPETFNDLFEEIIEKPHVPHDWGAENPM